MIGCKKHFITLCFSLIIPVMVWAEAPVVDESDNFAILDEQQSAVRSKYDEPQVNTAYNNSNHNAKYYSDDGPALAHEEMPAAPHQSNTALKDSASLVERVQILQKELQELRGQMEVQAHELQMLKEQQLTFYKDLDARISTNGAKAPSLKASTPQGSAAPTASVANPAKSSAQTIAVVSNGSKANPADEQIAYLAAYELIKNKQYDKAIAAMQHFVQKYPQGGYSANAYYWLGELYLVKKNYTKAASYFETVLKEFPSSNKKAASLLKAGYAYAAAGNNQLAKQRLQQVVTSFPNTSTAQLASLKLETLNTM
ncbi:MAG: tol-pal system protein YbgF [Legionella sp.]|nr:MAG: tol-pal system protein YbgF [Legionella sp.]PJD98613.1 MAG: tol-pal system protein YbgF [Legionella sp.]